MDNRRVRLELDNRIALLTVDNPPVNAFSQEVKEDLLGVLGKLEAIPDLAAAILIGAGDKVFVAGADIKSMVGITPQLARERLTVTKRILDCITYFPCPFLCAIEGAALGAGCELAMACDIRVASRSATIGLPEVRLGIIPGAGGSQRLPRLIGEGIAKKMILTGEPVGAEEAWRIGLVSLLTEPGQALAEARKLAETIRSRGPLAVRAAKRAITLGLERTLDEGLQLEIELFAQVSASEDLQEGVRAFIEKRKPAFRGK
jgi:enoyl-CoA hydratase